MGCVYPSRKPQWSHGKSGIVGGLRSEKLSPSPQGPGSEDEDEEEERVRRLAGVWLQEGQRRRGSAARRERQGHRGMGGRLARVRAVAAMLRHAGQADLEGGPPRSLALWRRK